MNDNWYALFIAIQVNCTPEQAFRLFVKGKRRSPKRMTEQKQKDIEDMRIMKLQGMTYEEIGEIYGLCSSSICRKINMAKSKVENYELTKEMVVLKSKGVKITEIAKKYGMKYAAVWNRIHEFNRKKVQAC